MEVGWGGRLLLLWEEKEDLICFECISCKKHYNMGTISRPYHLERISQHGGRKGKRE